MRKQLRPFALFTCITAATAFGGQIAFADNGTPAEQSEARSWQQQKHKGHKGHRGERFFKKMARELGLTDQQKTQAKELFDSSRAQHKPLLDSLRTEKGQLQTLVLSGSADEAAIRAQAAKVADVGSDLAVLKGKQAKQFLALLTPEQAVRLKEIQGKHQGKHRRNFGGFDCQEGPEK